MDLLILYFVVKSFRTVNDPLGFCLLCSDDGVSPDRVAQVMGQPDHCHHAAHLIHELVQTAQVCIFLLEAPGKAVRDKTLLRLSWLDKKNKTLLIRKA